mmetsp:Transcript_15318/g.43973  ORF Transcript_15318/g.43973 Transcript_15318/m.43973 type:complete len:212 (-) Transcript_15318:32-667(-)
MRQTRDLARVGWRGARCREGRCKKPIPVVRPAPPHATRRERLHRRANLANHRHRHRHLLCRAHLRDLLLPGGSGGQGPSPPHHCGRARREARLRSDAVEPSPPQAGAHIAVNSRVWSVGRSRDVCISCPYPERGASCSRSVGSRLVGLCGAVLFSLSIHLACLYSLSLSPCIMSGMVRPCRPPSQSQEWSRVCRFSGFACEVCARWTMRCI